MLLLSIVSAMSRADVWLGAGVHGGFAQMNYSLDIAKPRGGFYTGLGFALELQKGHFLFAPGVELAFRQTVTKLDDRQLAYTMLDTEGVQFIYNGDVTRRTDYGRSTELRLPIMFGAELRQHVYLLAGLKVNISLAASTKQTAYLSTVGDYDRYYELLHDMPNHGFHSREKHTDKNDFQWNTDVMLYAELGGWWLAQRSTYGGMPIKFRLALFGEYGLLDVRKSKSPGLLYDVDNNHYMDIKMNYVFNSSGIDNTLHNYTVGLRFTVLFRVQQSPSCKNCEWNK